jgi:Putative Flp pilus-assembly TadE/G-like
VSPGTWTPPLNPEEGGATLVGLALAGFVLLAGVAAVDVGALAGARAAAQTAADMAALAALTPQDGREERAAEIAAANGAELVACDCSAVRAVVSVRRRQRLLPGGLMVVLTARARAVLGEPPTASRATVRAVDLSRAADGNQATRPRDPAGGDAAGRPTRQCQRGNGGGAVRSVRGRGPGRCPRRATHQPRGPPDGPGRAPAGGSPAGGRTRAAAGPMGAAAPVRAAGTGAVRGLPADVQHRAAVHRGVAGSGDARHHADLERAAGQDRRGAPGQAPGRRCRAVGGRHRPGLRGARPGVRRRSDAPGR